MSVYKSEKNKRSEKSKWLFQKYTRFNCEIVYFSGNSSCSYGESANVLSQQDLNNVSVGKVDSFVFWSLFEK